MKNLKKLIAIIMVIALMIPCTAMAATESVTSQELTKKNTTITCTGKKQTPKTIKVQYKTKSGKKVTLKAGTDYTVKVTSGKNAGTYSVKITGKGKYAGKVSSSYTIKKATQKKLTVKNGYKTKKASTFKKKAKSYTFKVSGVSRKVLTE